MRAMFLGSGGYHPNDSRQTTCVMVPEAGIVFDAGTAAFRVRRHVTTPELDVFLSHVHLDHVVGLTYLLDVSDQTPRHRVRVYAERQKLEALRSQLFSSVFFPVPPPFECVAMPERVSVGAGGELSHCRLDHPGGCMGFRVDWPGHSLAFITDTTANPDAPYVDFIRQVDLLIHECHFPDGCEELASTTGHSCTSGVARVARAAQVGRMVLIHINPALNESDPIDLAVARAVFPNTEIATDGHAVDF